MRTCIIILSLFFISNSCKKDNTKLPKVTTSPITEVTWEYAIAGGEVIDDGGSPVIERGIYTFTENEEPWKTIDSSGSVSFTSKIDVHWYGMRKDYTSIHYIKAYATNKAGTSYGEELSFTPRLKPPGSSSISIASVTPKTTSAIIKYYNSFSHTSNPVAERGICYATSPGPEFNENHIVIEGTNNSPVTIENLLPLTTYYVRGYAYNESGALYSEEISFTTHEGEISDINGNIYQIKTIGNQVWTIENLKASSFNDGTIIPTVQENLGWSSTTTSAFCTYDNDIYAKLYNYYAVADSRKLCPAGWHVPSDDEWKILEIYLGMTQTQADNNGLRGTDEGGKLKQPGCPDNGWSCQNIGATNSSGFSAIGGGYRYDTGIFSGQGTSASFWSNSEYGVSTAWSRSLSNNNTQVGRMNINKGFGFSIRCIKD
jgi:uncharacterized protein (TIGR02145 family)